MIALNDLLNKITKLCEANVKWLESLKFAVHDKTELIAQLGAATFTLKDRCKEITLLAQICVILARDMNSIKNIDQGKCHNLAEASLAEVAKLIQGAGDL